MPISNYLPSSRLIQPGVCTSTTRPASPFEGQAIYETDTDRMLIWNGSAWLFSSTPQTLEMGVWTTFTPNFRPSSGTWSASSTNHARYTRIGKTIFGQARIDITSAGTGSGYVLFDLPVTSLQGNTASIGGGREANLTGNSFTVQITNTTTAQIAFFNNGGTAGANHTFGFNFMYEAA